MDFEQLFRANYPKVLAYARTMAAAQDADDAVAEAFAIAWRRQGEIQPEAELGWLFGITRRVLSNARRSERRVGALRTLIGFQPATLGPDPADRVEDGALRMRLTRARRRLRASLDRPSPQTEVPQWNAT